MVTREQVARAREEAEASGGTLDPVECLKKDGSVREQDLLAMLAQQYGMEVLDLNSYEIPPEILECLTPEVASRYKVVPVMKHDDVLTIAMSDPTDMETLDALRYLLGTEVDAMVASKSQIDAILDRHYRTGADSVEGYLQEMTEDADLDTELVSNIGQAESLDDENAPIIRLVTQLIIDAFKMKASDIHLEPMEKRYRVRYRIDGALREVEGPPKYMQANFTSRVKIMARLDITEKRIPQDGRIQVTVGDRDIDLRVSSVPTVHGESIVMRILDKSSIQLDVPKLGFYADDLEIVNRIISLPDGIFLVTGPTGSGKTTSLYAFLNTINTTSRKIITVEDPVEYQLSGINQVQVDRHVEMTFAAALRSKINCRKVHIVPGNHDKDWTHKDVVGTFIVEPPIVRINIHGQKIVLSHYPLMEWQSMSRGSWHLHGHIHSAGSVYNELNRKQGLMRYDVGVDANDLAPVSLDEIRAWFEGVEFYGRARWWECVNGTGDPAVAEDCEVVRELMVEVDRDHATAQESAEASRRCASALRELGLGR